MTVTRIKLATYFISGLGIVSTPVGISRLKSGAWSIDRNRFKNLMQYTFFDETHGGAGQALYAAVRMLGGRDKFKLRALERIERVTKYTRLDLVGISYYVTSFNGRTVHRFGVNTPGSELETRTVYIGSDSTYLKNWDAALEKAADLRHAWERERTIKSYWTGLNPQPKSKELMKELHGVH